ncbi:MAG: hypothetical protein IPK57_10730 [Chitinophagaceae bacterium]|nr:hypothetical protein [Chitinophagaceae bacterium]
MLRLSALRSSLPRVVQVYLPGGAAYGGGTITYTYDAAGRKLSKAVEENPSHKVHGNHYYPVYSWFCI